MKRIICALFLLSVSAHADGIDKVIQDAVRRGAHGMSYKAMRDMVEMGAHYEPRDNSWTNEKEYHPVSEYAAPSGRKHWMYFNSWGSIWVDGILMHYQRSRGLMEGGHRYIIDGHTVWQVKLFSGQWVDVYPQ